MRHFRVWHDAGNRPETCIACLEAILEGRAAYLDRKDPTRWRRGDLRALLYELAVPRLSEYCDLVAHTVPGVDAYLCFLDQTDRLHPSSTAVRHLRQELAQQAHGFPAAMADRARFRMAKTFYQAMIADGVRVGDDEAVDAWMARFNQAPEGDRVPVLEHLLAGQPELLTADFAARAGKVAALPPGQPPFDSRRLLPVQDREPDVMPIFAPVGVPSRAEAAAAARGSALLRDLLTLARWFEQGRRATNDGVPTPPDVRSLAGLLGLGLPGTKVSHLHQVPGLSELFWMARQFELVELRRSGLVAGPRLAAGQNDEEVLHFWQQVLALVETCSEIPEEAPASTRTPFTAISAMARRCVPGMMVSLYRSAAGNQVPDHHQAQQVTDLVSPHVHENLEQGMRVLRNEDEEEMAETALRIGLCLSLDRLIEHGVLELSGPGLTELAAASRPETHGLPIRTILMASNAQLWLRLTPLGRWGIREALATEGAEAPSAGPAGDHGQQVLDLDTSVPSPSG